MFTIDFLQGKGLPQKSDPYKVGALTFMAVVFVIVVCFYCLRYAGLKSQVGNKQHSLKQVETLLAGARGKLSTGQQNKDLASLTACRSEIAESLDRYFQWTPVLVGISETLPGSMLLDELDVLRTLDKLKVTSKKNPDKKVDHEVIRRSLTGVVFDFAGDGDIESVNSLLYKWQNSSELDGAFQEVYLSESSDAQFEKQDKSKVDVKRYVIKGRLASEHVEAGK